MSDENSKSLAITSEEQNRLIAEARNSSGEGVRLNIKFVSFNGKDGIYFMSTGQKNEAGKTIKENLGAGYQGIVLKNRNRVNVYNPKNPLAAFRSEEFDNTQNEVIRVYNGNSQLVGQGTYKDLKLKIPGLTLEKVLYIKEVEGDGIVKLSVGGTSIKPWFDYLKTFAADDTSIRYITIFGAEPKSNEFGDFHIMKFSKGETVDIVKAIEYQRGLNMALNTIRNINNQTIVPTAHGEVDADFTYTEENGTEIRAEDIPF